MALTDAGKAGALLVVGVVQFALFEMVAEFVYPGYSVSNNYISDLGPPCSTGVACPSVNSWYIFDGSIIVLGLFLLASSYFLYRFFRWKPVAGLIMVNGLGAIGVGVFNETAPYGLHGLFSLITFLSIGLSAIISYRLQKPLLGLFSVIMGLITLISLLLYVNNSGSFGTTLGIGPGGLERLIVYPVLFWSIAFGGHLMAMDEKSTV